MRPIDVSFQLDVSIRARPWSPRRLLSGGRPAAWLVLGAAVVFFALPVVWLLLEATRTQADAAAGGPLGFGSFGQLQLNWDVLTETFGKLGTWIGNSALYS